MIRGFCRQKLTKKKGHQSLKYLNTENLEVETLKNIAIIATSWKITYSIPDGVVGIFIGTILPVALRLCCRTML